MPRLPNSDRGIQRLETPTEKRYEMYRDEAVKGLVLRIMKTGHRAWVAERRKPNGSKQETPLGVGDSLTLAEAREACIKALAEKESEERNVEERTPGTLAAEFEDYCLANRIIPEHAKEYRRTLSIYGAAIWNMPVNKITRSLVLKTRERIKEGDFEENLPYTPERGGAAKANDFIRYGSMVMAWSQNNKENPFHGIQPLPRDNEEGESKKYVFQPKDWPAIFDVIERWNSDDRDLILTHIMLGARPAGTCRMRWDRLDLDKGTYKLTNNPEECMGWKPAKSPSWAYPVDDYTLERLRERKQFAHPGVDFIFPSPYENRKNQPITNRPLESLFRELRVRLNLPAHCTAYSARYTRATYSEMAFGSTHITSRMLNHRTDTGKGGKNATHKYIITGPGEVGDASDEQIGYKTLKAYVNRYSEIILELAGRRELSEATRILFHLPQR